jgi:hypothetical protein
MPALSPTIWHKLGGIGLVAVIATLPACTSSDHAAKAGGPDRAKALLTGAKTTLDAASGVHLVLTSADVPGGTSSLVGGNGVAVRPDRFKGDLKVVFAGAQVSVGIVSVGGKTYAKLPFTSAYTVTDPAKYGFVDPGRLMDPKVGISNLLVQATGARLGKKERIGGEVVQEIQATLPGTAVKTLLASADATQPVPVTFGVVESNSQLRRAVVTGPFFKKGVESTYTIVLDRYGEKVDIRAPSTG